MRMFADAEDESTPKFTLKCSSALVAATSAVAIAALCALVDPSSAQAQAKPPNIVMLMTDDTGWNDFGAYSGGGAALGHPTPNVDRIAKEGAIFTSWYGQASCTAGRASFITGRIPIRSALSIVVAPGDENYLRKETPTIAEFFQKNGYSTYFSGKWHLGDKPKSYPIEHGFDEMKHFAAYYAGVYAYNDTSNCFHPWFPTFNPEFEECLRQRSSISASGKASPASRPRRSAPSPTIRLPTFDIRQTDSAVDYIKEHAKDDKPFFMDVNFIKMHNPTNAAPEFRGKSHLGDYSDSLMELDDDIGRIMDAIRAEAPDTIVIVTADNGAWLDAYPDAGTTPFRGEKGSAFEGGWRVPAVMWWPGHVQAGAKYRRDDVAYRLLGDARRAWSASPRRRMIGSAMTASRSTSTASTTAPTSSARPQHSARTSWIYIDGETFDGVRVDISGDPNEPWVHMAWKYIYTAKDSWLGPVTDLGAIGALYNLTMDPYEKYDMIFNGAAPMRVMTSSPGRYAGEDNGWVLALISPVMRRLRQVDHEISEHHALSRRGFDRPDARSAAAAEPAASAEAAAGAARADRRRRRLDRVSWGARETRAPHPISFQWLAKIAWGIG